MTIQSGEREKLPELWEQVERFVAVKAQQRMVLAGGFGGVTFDDLYNSGYLALAAAVDTFDAEQGKAFIGWLSMYLKTAFAEAGGYRSQKQAHDPLHAAGSLDAPLDDDKGDATLVNTIPDPDATQGFEDAENRVWNEQLHAVLEKALRKLPADQSDVLRRKYYVGQTLGEIAAADGLYPETVRKRQEKGLRALRRSKCSRELSQFVELRTPYHRHTGVHRFNETHTSDTEWIVLERERLTQEWIERVGR